MITKRVLRYYCEHCKKCGGSSFHMKTHEIHCTMNPFRVCRVCPLVEETQRPIRELMAMLPEEVVVWHGSELEWEISYSCSSWPGIDKAVVKLRELTGCPACMMAALRQKGIPVGAAYGFDYKAEMSIVFAGGNTNG